MRKWMRRGAAAFMAAAMMVAGTGCGKKLEPKEAVSEAFKSFSEDETVKPFEELTGLKQIMETASKTGGEVGFSLRLDDLMSMELSQLAGLGIEWTSKSDVEKQQDLLTMGVQYGGNTLVTGNVYLDDTYIKANVPELSKSLFTLDYSNDLVGQIQNGDGYLAKMIREQGEISGIDFTNLDKYIEDSRAMALKEDQLFDIGALWNRYKEGSQAIKNLKEAMQVTQGDTVNLEVNGKEQKCQGYDVVISKDAAVEFMRTTTDFFLQDETIKQDVITYLDHAFSLYGSYGRQMQGIMSGEEQQQKAWQQAEEQMKEFLSLVDESMGDLNMKVYVGPKGKLASLTVDTSFTNNSDEVVDVAFDAAFKGGAYQTQNMDATLTFTKDGEELNISLAKQGVYDKKQLTSDINLSLSSPASEGGETYSLLYTGTYDVESKDYHVQLEAVDDKGQGAAVSITGVVNELEKGKSFDVFLDAVDVTVNGQKVAGLSGRLYLKPLEGTIEEPVGEKELDILAATESDWANVGQEMLYTLFGILGPLMGAAQ